MRWIVAILVLYLTSCTNSKRSEIGKFVYVDCFNTVHTNRNCAANLVDDPKTKDERMADMQGIQFIDTCYLNMGVRYSTFPFSEHKFCPKCVDDEAFQHLSLIIERNENKAQ